MIGRTIAKWTISTVLFTAAFHGASLAQEIAGRHGTLSAKSFAPVADRARIAVEFRDDTELNQQLRQVVEEALTSLGFQVRKGAPLILTINSEAVRSSSDQPRVGIQGGAASGGQQHLQLHFKVPLTGGRSPDPRTRHRISMTLAASGTDLVWTAEANAQVLYRDRITIQSAMARRLVESLGKTVGSSQFPLD